MDQPAMAVQQETLPIYNEAFRPGIWPLPPDEPQRIQALHDLDILDTAAETAFDNIVSWGRRTFNVPICLVSLVDTNRQWFKSCYGLTATETSRDSAFCAHAIMPGAPEVLEVCDTHQDVRFLNNPLVIGPPHIRYYAGAPLAMGERKLGTFCVIDTKPRGALSERERSILNAERRFLNAER